MPAISNALSIAPLSQEASLLGVQQKIKSEIAGSSPADPSHELLSLKFRIDVGYLVLHTLIRCSEGYFVRGLPNQHIVDFQNQARSTDAQAYRFLQYGIEPRLLIDGDSLAELAARAEQLLAEMSAAPSFERILEETRQSLVHVEAQWQSDLQISHQIMCELTGIKFTGQFDVFLTHPAQRNGRNLGGTIVWSYRNSFPHYNTVYLWHEVLHNFLDGGDVVHCVIELLADNELRVRLGGRPYPPLKGHAELRDFKQALLPAWQHYLERSDKNIFQFIEEATSISAAQKNGNR